MNFSFASAAIASVSSVMKFDCTHAAREAFTARVLRRTSVSAMNFSASARVAFPAGALGDAVGALLAVPVLAAASGDFVLGSADFAGAWGLSDGLA